MSDTYAGNAASYPTEITIPADGDGPGISAADVNSAFEGLADRSAYLKDAIGQGVDVLTGASGTYVVPDETTALLVQMIGGGGGGGGGAGGTADGSNGGGGGGGGGAAGLVTALIGVTPGESIAWTQGAAGTAGAAGAEGVDGTAGGAGGDTEFGDLIARGAAGGAGGKLIGTADTKWYSLGGGPGVGTAYDVIAYTPETPPVGFGGNGFGHSKASVPDPVPRFMRGAGSGASHGGISGTNGANDGTRLGGGCGGGGAATFWADENGDSFGGNGGNGSAATSGSASSGTNGTAGGVGGGGGGGGGGGCGGVVSGGGGAGAAGGTGRIRLFRLGGA